MDRHISKFSGKIPCSGDSKYRGSGDLFPGHLLEFLHPEHNSYGKGDFPD